MPSLFFLYKKSEGIKPSSVERKKYENQPQGMKVCRIIPTTIIILIVLIKSNVITNLYV